MNDDLDRLLTDAMHERSSRVRPDTGDVHDVYARAERAQRHRSTTVLGATATVALAVVVGVFVASSDGGRPANLAGAPADRSRTDVPAGVHPTTADGTVWACTDEVAVEDPAPEMAYFATCSRLDAAISDATGVTTTVIAPATQMPVPVGACIEDDDGRCPVPVEQAYVVVMGDFLIGIAEAFGVEAEQIAAYNEWPEGLNHPLSPGDIILIPPGALRYEPPDAVITEVVDVTTIPDATTSTP